MKHFSLALTLMLAFTGANFTVTNAQSLTLGVSVSKSIDEDRFEVSNGSEFYFFGVKNEIEAIQIFLTLTNTTTNDIYVSCRATPILEPMGTVFSWCGFGTCVGVYAMDHKSLAAGYTEGANAELYVEPELNEEADPATYLLSFYVEDNSEDERHITVHFVDREKIPADVLSAIGGAAPQSDTIVFISGGIVTSNEIFARSQNTPKVYPNPAIDYVTFDMGDEKGDVIIRSVAGNIVRRLQNVSGFASTNMKGLASGMYFYTIERSNGEKTTGKLIVR
ncbi:MAG: T9SS type A sorting domain-containing protein [Bacteroidales bacterium]|jgi:hypothetical protein|nr:T9SS type A sorting domain-containing protein [Bacteroidales bacterium]